MDSFIKMKPELDYDQRFKRGTIFAGQREILRACVCFSSGFPALDQRKVTEVVIMMDGKIRGGSWQVREK